MTGRLDAGEFGAWLDELAAALRGDGETDVACGTCVACCSSGQFVHIGPDEVDALAHIPPALLFPAPRMPEGTVLMGYDEHGRCPMLGDGGCSIYAHRPRTCRTYDCRVFAAAGVYPTEAEKSAIAERARRWEFTYGGATERELHDAARTAAAAAHAADAAAPATQVAVHAVRVVLSRR